jgi:hypothetical protein
VYAEAAGCSPPALPALHCCTHPMPPGRPPTHPPTHPRNHPPHFSCPLLLLRCLPGFVPAAMLPCPALPQILDCLDLPAEYRSLLTTDDQETNLHAGGWIRTAVRPCWPPIALALAPAGQLP